MSKIELQIMGETLSLLENERSLPLYTTKYQLAGFVKEEDKERVLTYLADCQQIPAEEIFVMKSYLVVRGEVFHREGSLRPSKKEKWFLLPGKPIVVSTENGYLLFSPMSDEYDIRSTVNYLLALDSRYLHLGLFTEAEMLSLLLSNASEEEKKFAKGYLNRLEDPTENYNRVEPQKRFCYYCSRFFVSNATLMRHMNSRTHVLRLPAPRPRDEILGLTMIWRKLLGLL